MCLESVAPAASAGLVGVGLVAVAAAGAEQEAAESAEPHHEWV